MAIALSPWSLPRLASCRPACPTRPARAAGLRPADHRLRPERQGRARPLPAGAAPVVTFDQIPQLVLDATTAAEDRTFWDERGLRPRRDRRRPSPRSVRAAASAAPRPSPSSSSAPDCCPRTCSRPAPTATCARPRRSSSRALTDAFPGEAGKQRIITAYLNQIFYGHNAYGIAAAARGLLRRRRLAKLTPAQAALLAGLPQVADDARPVSLRRARTTKGRLVVPPTASAVVRRNWILPAWPRRPLDHADPSELAGRADGARRPGRRPAATCPGRPVHLAGPTPARSDPRAATSTSRPAATGSSPRSTGAPSSSPRSGSAAGRHRARTCRAQARPTLLTRSRSRRGRPALDQRPARQGPPQRRAGGARLPDRRRAGLRRQRRATTATTSPAPVRAQVRRRGRRLPPAGLGLEADPLRNRVRAHACSRPAASCWTSRPSSTAARTGPRATPTSWSAARCSSARRSSTRSTSRRSGRLSGSATSAVADTAEAMGIRFAGGKKAILQAGLAGALGTVEVTPARPGRAYGTFGNGGVARAAADDPRGPRADGKVVWAPASRGRASGLAADRLPHHRHPRRQHRSAQNTIWAGSSSCATARTAAPPGGGQDRHDQRRPRPRARTASCPPTDRRRRPGRRRLDGQQRPLVSRATRTPRPR